MSALGLEAPRAYQQLGSSAAIRTRYEDFRVDEELGFEPAGEGEHRYLQVRKRGANTRWVAEQLAEHYGVGRMDVGYAGLKDRHGVATQWFSVRDPTAREPSEPFALDCVEVLRVERHTRKLRRGAHRCNRFRLTLRGARLDPPVEARLRAIARQGVPNYFGAQRFGREGRTLTQALSWLERGRPRIRPFERGLYLSAARAWLFNRVLAMRVRAGSWHTALDGDVLEHGVPTGPLWGRGRTGAAGEAARAEHLALDDAGAVRDALEHAGLMQQRRPLVLVPWELRYRRESDDVIGLSFSLGPGGYATVVLRELMDVRDHPGEART